MVVISDFLGHSTMNANVL